MRETLVAGYLFAALLAGCPAPGVGTRVPVPAPGTALRSPAPIPGVTPSAPTGARPASGSDSDLDRQLTEAFGPMDPAFVIRSPDPQASQQPGNGGNLDFP